MQVKTTGKFDTRSEWEREVLAMFKRGTTRGVIAKLTESSLSSVTSFIQSKSRKW